MKAVVIVRLRPDPTVPHVDVWRELDFGWGQTPHIDWKLQLDGLPAPVYITEIKWQEGVGKRVYIMGRLCERVPFDLDTVLKTWNPVDHDMEIR